MSDDKTPNSNGLSTDPLKRLASLKPPRDLSLGGIKPNKKLFTPNLNVSRNKNKGSNASNDSRKDDKHEKDHKNRNYKNNKGPKLIKSSGVFSEGLGATERHSSRGTYTRDVESSAALQKPTIRVKDFIKIDKELEDKKIKSVTDDGLGDDEESIDFKNIKERDAPIKLPMDDGYVVKPKPAIKQEVIVKTEPTEFGDSLESLVRADVKKEPYEATEVVNLLKTDEPTLILLQLPDTLPGRGGSRDDDGPRRKHDEPSTSTEKTATEEVDNRCRLSDLEEGRIGKLRVHRSGRVTLLLGDTVFEVSMGTKVAFHQEVVSVACDDASRSANLVSLGNLQHKLNLIPDWETMFQDIVL